MEITQFVCPNCKQPWGKKVTMWVEHFEQWENYSDADLKEVGIIRSKPQIKESRPAAGVINYHEEEVFRFWDTFSFDRVHKTAQYRGPKDGISPNGNTVGRRSFSETKLGKDLLKGIIQDGLNKQISEDGLPPKGSERSNMIDLMTQIPTNPIWRIYLREHEFPIRLICRCNHREESFKP